MEDGFNSSLVTYHSSLFMTLAELANYITTKTQLVEPDDLAAAQLFLSKRYELIYNSYLWKDALTMMTVAVNPATNPDHALGIVLMPQQIDRVVALRTAQSSVRVHGLEDFYRTDFNEFTQTGMTTGEFAMLDPVWFSCRPDPAFFADHAAGRIPSGSTLTGPNAFVTISSNNAADTAPIKVVWRDNNDRYVLTAPKPVTLTPGDGSGFLEVEAVFKPVTQGTVSVLSNTPQPVADTDLIINITSTLGSLAPASTRSPQHQRVRLFAIPTEPFSLMALGKKPFVPLDYATEKPLIKNLDNCLIAFGTADLLQRARQFGKAAQQMQEGAALLAELAKLEVLQATNNSRFVPDGGYGDPFFAPSSNRGLWV